MPVPLRKALSACAPWATTDTLLALIRWGDAGIALPRQQRDPPARQESCPNRVLRGPASTNLCNPFSESVDSASLGRHMVPRIEKASHPMGREAFSRFHPSSARRLLGRAFLPSLLPVTGHPGVPYSGDPFSGTHSQGVFRRLPPGWLPVHGHPSLGRCPDVLVLVHALRYAVAQWAV